MILPRTAGRVPQRPGDDERHRAAGGAEGQRQGSARRREEGRQGRLRRRQQAPGRQGASPVQDPDPHEVFQQ